MGKRSGKIRRRKLYAEPDERAAVASGGASLAAPAGVLTYDQMSPMQRLAYMRLTMREIEEDALDEVGEARAAGHSWHDIGRQFDITGEGARKRWAPRLAERGAGSAGAETGRV